MRYIVILRYQIQSIKDNNHNLADGVRCNSRATTFLQFLYAQSKACTNLSSCSWVWSGVKVIRMVACPILVKGYSTTFTKISTLYQHLPFSMSVLTIILAKISYPTGTQTKGLTLPATRYPFPVICYLRYFELSITFSTSCLPNYDLIILKVANPQFDWMGLMALVNM